MEQFDPSLHLGFCTLCFHFPTKMLHLDALFYPLICPVSPKNSLKCTVNARKLSYMGFFYASTQFNSSQCLLRTLKFNAQSTNAFWQPSIKFSAAPPGFRPLPSTVSWTELCNNDLIPARSAVFGRWEEQPNIWLTVVKDKKISRWHWVKSTEEFRNKFKYKLFQIQIILTPWCNGSASDSRSEGCVFESRRGQQSFCGVGFPFCDTP